MMRYGAVCCGLMVSLSSIPVWAESPTMMEAIEVASSSGVASMKGLATLESRGARVTDVLVVESLPKGGIGAEVLVTFKGHRLRYPIKLATSPAPEGSCGQGSWTVTWTPDEAYANALLNVATSGAMPEYDASANLPEWHTMPRQPALPLVVTQSAIFTPYGKIAWSELDLDPSSPQAEVMPPEALVQHTRTWINDYLEDEQGAAGVDIVADARLGWQELNRVIFGVSSMGLYKVYLMLSADDDTLHVVESAAPVFGSMPGVEKPVPLVLGYYPVKDETSGEFTHGWRVSQGKAVLSDEGACADEMSFCTADVATFSTRFTELVARMRAKKPENPRYAMFASTRETTLGAAMAFLQHAGAALGIPQGRVFIGYIQR